MTGSHKAEIIVIGGGAAGMMAAAGASQTFRNAGRSESVVILEKMPRPGRKIMITGKGRCNFSNVKPWNEFSSHIHPKANFLKASFHNLTPERLMDFFSQNGMDSLIERGDRAFPTSQLSSEVVDTLVRAAENYGAELHCGKEVCNINQAKDGSFDLLCSDGSRYSCRRLIICTGGLSYPKTGSSGDGYGWAKEMGHSIRPLFPSLTALVPKGYKDMHPAVEKTSRGHIDRNTPLSELGRILCGNQLKNIEIRVEIDGNVAQSEFGDLDFTDGGMEGPVGFRISRKCVNALINGSKVCASLDLKPAVEQEALHQRIKTVWDEICRDRRNAGRQYKERFRILLGKLMPQSLIAAFMHMNPNIDHNSLAKVLKNWKFEFEGYVGYERCVITAGGVSLDEITAKTLESRLIPGLYFAGEILDMDADTGGYNLHIAFSTGYLAGISAAKKVQETDPV